MNRIITNPKILGGKPIIKGTRLSVKFIMNLLGSGASYQEILNDYPHISVEDIYACLNFAAKTLKNDVYFKIESA